MVMKQIPVTTLVPAEEQDSVFGFMAGEFRITGDIESPITPLDGWQVLRETKGTDAGKKGKKL